MKRGIAIAAVLLGLGGCTFNGTGGSPSGPKLGEPDLDRPGATEGAEPEPEPGGATDGVEPGPEPMGTGDDGSDAPPSDDPVDLPPPDDATGGDDMDGTGTTGQTPPAETCPDDFADLLWAEDAVLGGPMDLATAVDAAGEPEVAVSGTPEAGTIEFDLDLPCAGEYFVWGLVWDYAPGAWATSDPDSWYVSTAGAPEFTWRYGCQTNGESVALTWQALERLDAQPCDVTPITLQAPEAGIYSLRLRNREAGSGSAVAGIGAIVVTNDPGLDPATMYAPY